MLFIFGVYWHKNHGAFKRIQSFFNFSEELLFVDDHLVFVSEVLDFVGELVDVVIGLVGVDFNVVFSKGCF